MVCVMITLKKIKKFFSGITTISVSHTYYYNGQKVKELPPEAKEQMEHMNKAFEHMNEAFKETEKIFK